MVDQSNTEKLQQLHDWMKNNMVSKADMDNALAAQDEDYANKFEQALNATDNKHAEQLQMAMEAIDKKRAQQLKFIYESIDKKHAQMIEEAVKKVDSDNAKKLVKVTTLLKENRDKAINNITKKLVLEAKQKIAKKTILFEQNLKAHKAELIKERNRKLDVLAESVQKYLNYALDNALPRKQLISEAKYNAAIKTIEKVTDVLKVNTIVQESKDGLFADYEAKIASGKNEQEKLLNENIELKTKLNKIEAQLVLEEKCKDCTPAEAKFVKAYFSKADKPEVIEESIKEARTAYKKLQSERRESLIAENAAKANATPTSVITEKQIASAKSTAKAKIVSESKAVKSAEKKQKVQPKKQDLIDLYAQALQGHK